MESRVVSWINACNRIITEARRIDLVNLKELDYLTDEEFDYFIGMFHRTADDVKRSMEAASNTVGSRRYAGSPIPD